MTVLSLVSWPQSTSPAPGDLQKLASTHAHLGQVFEVQGRFHAAIAQYTIALSKYPGSIEAADGLQRLGTQERRSAGGSDPTAPSS